MDATPRSANPRLFSVCERARVAPRGWLYRTPMINLQDLTHTTRNSEISAFSYYAPAGMPRSQAVTLALPLAIHLPRALVLTY